MKKQIQRPYWQIEGLEQLYLEDSYILSLHETDQNFILDCEFVLREGHPKYHPPNPDEKYCYIRGKMDFGHLRKLVWMERHDVIASDATGQSDLGNIDALYETDGVYVLEGEVGIVRIESDSPIVTYR